MTGAGVQALIMKPAEMVAPQSAGIEKEENDKSKRQRKRDTETEIKERQRETEWEGERWSEKEGKKRRGYAFPREFHPSFAALMRITKSIGK